MKNFVKATIVLLLLSIVGYFFASPYIVLNNIKQAVKQGDSKAVSTYIDYPSVRESVKEQVNKQMQTKARKTAGKLGAFGALLASNLVNDVVDDYVTPQSMHMLFKGTALWNDKQPSKDQPSETNNNQSKPKDDNLVDYDMGYTSLNRFEVKIGKKDSNNKVTVIMHRDGISWKVKEIALPLNKQ